MWGGWPSIRLTVRSCHELGLGRLVSTVSTENLLFSGLIVRRLDVLRLLQENADVGCKAAYTT